ncbi:TRAP transporter small permease [Bacillus sp. AGMB 02131]|uniref:TRAP transporter small permease n=1 Tax=Peribacillus faecalis TaxID=2772559 RepID=A0A927CVE7_9BACI|nr:TRAP transporter small permease [Peribacillus faecalis]MBD3108328.1 TRAP transporter small permease [Peribacillus faecalis]
MALMKNMVDKIDKLLVYLSCSSLFILMILVIVNVSSRFIFDKPIIGVIEFTGEYLLVIMVYFSLSFTYLHDEHIKITFLFDKFPSSIQQIIKILTNMICIVFLIIVCVVSIQEGVEYYDRGLTSTSSLNYPLFPALLIISVGIFVFILRILLETIEILISVFRKAKPKV